MFSEMPQSTGPMILCIALAAVFCVYAGSSKASLPRCRDSVCAQDPHCNQTRAAAVCWNVNSTAVLCTCCQNCLKEGAFIGQDCAEKILACNPWYCPHLFCAYGSYLPDCDCCSKCLPKECNNVHDEMWPNCHTLCLACPTGTKSSRCPKTCCPVCIKK
ncbi:uncharacterized protein LOC144139435 [Haemaphysalis longicornis]